MRKVWVALAAALSATAMSGRQGGREPLTVSAVRFYSPVSATTTIEGVCELRLGALPTGVAQTVRYRLEVAVFDSAGLELQRNDWQREVPAAVARARGATSVETFGFRAAPGRYRVRVRAIPETGPVVEGETAVEAYAAVPAISDLLLATAVRAAADDTSPTAPGEIRRGNLVLRTAPLPQLSPADASLTYYAEVYLRSGAATDGELRVAVLGVGGGKVIETPAKAVRIGPTGGLTQGSVDLAGLPTGDYVLQLAVRRGDSTVTTQAPFAMGAMRVAASAAAPAAAPEGGTRADPFAEANETQLDSMYAPLTYLLEAREQGVYGNLAVEGKRRFLRDFWQRRGRQAMEQLYRGVRYANDAFREGGAGQIPGWRTDRGRIFLKYGRWDELMQRPMASPKAFEVWKYTRERQRYYVFMDQSGVGHYVLLGTNDRRETGLPNWEKSLSPEDYQDVARFLGLSDQLQQP
jgi:GWxTD domain-containing protein